MTSQHDRLPGAAQHRRGPLDLRCRRLVRPGDIDVEGSKPLRHAHGLDVLGHGQIDRAGTFGLRQLERLADHLRDRARGQHHVRPLGYRREHRHQIDALVGLLVDPVQADLCRQSHYRRTVRRRICRAQEQVDRARSQGRRAHPGAPTQATVDLGHERRRLLVAHQHIPDRRAGQGVSETDVLFARDTEHDGDALTLQAAHKQVRDTKLLGHHPSLPPDSFGLARSVARCWCQGGYQSFRPCGAHRAARCRRRGRADPGGRCHAGWRDRGRADPGAGGRVPGWSVLRRRATSVLVLGSFLHLILGRFLQFLVLLGRGHRAKEIEILALGIRSPFCTAR